MQVSGVQCAEERCEGVVGVYPVMNCTESLNAGSMLLNSCSAPRLCNGFGQTFGERAPRIEQTLQDP